MSRNALGMVETVGILAAYEAADVALKSANVKMLGYEISRGGMVVIKFTGDVGAVRSAVDAAKTAASQLSTVFSAHVIPRPSKDIDSMINSEDTVNNKKEEKNEEKEDEVVQEETEASSNKNNNQSEKKELSQEEENEASSSDVEEKPEEESEKNSEPEAEKEEKAEEDICNLCGDPACPRSKGDLHTDCIHYDELENDN